MQKKMKSVVLVFVVSLILALSNPLSSWCAGTSSSETSSVPQTSSGSAEKGKESHTSQTSQNSQPSKSSESSRSEVSESNSSAKKEEHEHSGGRANCSQKAICEVCGQEYGELDPDQHVTVEKSDDRTHFEECTLCNKKLNREPHRGGTATPTKLAVCEVCGASYGTVDLEHLVLDVPVAFSNLIYNGKPQSGVPEGEGYILDNNTETNAGTYVTTVTLEEGNEWSDGTKDPKEISWTIQRAAVAIHVMNYTRSYGEKDPEEFPVEWRGLIGDDKINYEISREEGEEVGTYKLILTGESKQGNYHVNFAPGKLTIKPLEIVPKITVRNKWFDGTVDADLIVELTGVQGDTLSIKGLSGRFEDGQVGKDKTVLLDSSKAQIVLNGKATAAADLKNYSITIPETVTGKIQGPYIGEYGEGSGKEESSEEESVAGDAEDSKADTDESSADSSTETSEESSEEESGETSVAVGETSGEESGETSVETSMETSGETSEQTSQEASGAESTGESSENTQEALRQLTSGDNWTLIWFVIFSLLGCFIAGIILAWKAEMEPKN